MDSSGAWQVRVESALPLCLFVIITALQPLLLLGLWGGSGQVCMDPPQGTGERALGDLLIHHSCTESQRKSHLGAALGNMVGDGWGTCLRQIPHSPPHSRLGQSQENLVLYCASSSLPWAYEGTGRRQRGSECVCVCVCVCVRARAHLCVSVFLY